VNVLVELENGDMVEFEVNEAGVIGTGNYFQKGQKYAIPIKPSVADVLLWLDEGEVLDIRFRSGIEMKKVLKKLITNGK